ncbi:hypothetical protein Q669_29075 [Labrenzia sp. C1B10]|uniref:TRAP transporter small permease n=1 Tax=unclassified Labrenzia TaxID=2648686 RepID=UPI0003B8FA28|nr:MULTISPECIES: TRAP transporter small permease subunit [unclassified Labrenzia]ERP96427.1 hypothetical protein Q669_29075 [Labrenzia sp. C1B10]ERS06943.1 hypothetical protein Q675_24935 [Labrenzia sp. C1B70]
MFATLDNLTGKVLRAVPILCLAALFVLLLANVFARTFQLAAFSWLDEVIQGLFAWMVFTGTAALWREKDHFQVDWLPSSLPALSSRILRLATTALSICFLAVMTIYGADLTLSAKALTPILGLPSALFYLSIPLSGAVMLVYSLADFMQLLSGTKTTTETTL